MPGLDNVALSAALKAFWSATAPADLDQLAAPLAGHPRSSWDDAVAEQLRNESLESSLAVKKIEEVFATSGNGCYILTLLKPKLGSRYVLAMERHYIAYAKAVHGWVGPVPVDPAEAAALLAKAEADAKASADAAAAASGAAPTESTTAPKVTPLLFPGEAFIASAAAAPSLTAAPPTSSTAKTAGAPAAATAGGGTAGGGGADTVEVKPTIDWTWMCEAVLEESVLKFLARVRTLNTSGNRLEMMKSLRGLRAMPESVARQVYGDRGQELLIFILEVLLGTNRQGIKMTQPELWNQLMVP